MKYRDEWCGMAGMSSHSGVAMCAGTAMGGDTVPAVSMICATWKKGDQVLYQV